MSKVFKGVGKALKSIGKAVKKVYKKIVESKIGKALLIGATIYLGGAAFGMWNSPFASVNGAFTAAGSQASQAAAASSTTASQLAATGTTASLAPGAGVLSPAAGGGAAGVIPATQTAGQTLAASVMPQAAGGTAGATVAGTTALAPGLMLPGGLGAASEGTAAKGILNRLLAGSAEKIRSAAGFVEEHPYATAMALNAASSMLSPDAVDIMEMQQQREDEERERREKNLDVRGINLGVTPSNREYSYTDGSPVYRNGGILNTTIARRS